jgi:nucleotide-binding universal stress UspA family protein
VTYASILVQVQTDENARRRLEVACDLARRFGAALTGVAVEMLPTAPFSDGYTNVDDGWFTAMRTMILDDQIAAQKLFHAAAADTPLGRLWVAGIDFPVAAIVRESRGADLIVTSRVPRGRSDPYKDAQPAELALKSGRPVLVTPDSHAAFLGRRVVLGWKDTREARRAMADAMPFFLAAEAVLVVEICGEDEAEAAEARIADVVRSLCRHGAKAEGRAVSEHLNAGLDILDQARKFDADLIVVGAYGHSRMGEWAFGGVTEELLAQTHRFVLLSH